ncbi:MAG TPA: hypothetical protein VK348_06035 [Planctomycetota bacterium]|nr:hypothetical protein [Planctomycetota bacterium]
MPRCSIAIVLLLCCPSACSPPAPASAGGDAVAKPVTPPAPSGSRHEGPPLQAAFDAGGALQVKMTAPTGGFELVRDAVVREGATAVVRLKLTAPGPTEMTTDATVEFKIPVPAKDLGDATAVRVDVSTQQRGVAYFVQPPFLAAVTVQRR